jgi:hypothetical protein
VPPVPDAGRAYEPYPPPGTQAPSAGTDAAVAIDARNQAVSRLRRMNLKHAQYAWDQRYSDPLAAYGLAFLFVQPDQRRRGWLAVKAATRLWLAGPEAENLPRLLFDLTEFVGRQMQAGPIDLRVELANRVDEGMADDAYYIGVGLSSLDTHTGSWGQVQEEVETVADVPGKVIIELTDQTLVVCERRGLREFNAFQIHSTHSLGDAFAQGVYRWSWSPPDQLRNDPAHADVLRWLEQLNLALWQADNARLVAAKTAYRTRGRGEHGR